MEISITSGRPVYQGNDTDQASKNMEVWKYWSTHIYANMYIRTMPRFVDSMSSTQGLYENIHQAVWDICFIHFLLLSDSALHDRGYQNRASPCSPTSRFVDNRPDHLAILPILFFWYSLCAVEWLLLLFYGPRTGLVSKLPSRSWKGRPPCMCWEPPRKTTGSRYHRS